MRLSVVPLGLQRPALNCARRAPVHLPPRACVEAGQGDMRVSVTGTVYPAPGGSPRVTLFTKNQCTLCDKVKAVLAEVREEGLLDAPPP